MSGNREVREETRSVGGKTHRSCKCGASVTCGNCAGGFSLQSPQATTSKMGGEQKLTSSSREMRNIAEKMRRDKLNNHINELAGIVPLGSGATKKIDKTSVLRLAANYIRMNKILREDEDGGTGGRLGEVLGGGIAHTLAEAVGGFLLVVTSTGKVVYITEAVDQFFGHSQVDLLGHSLYNVIHPDDHEIFQQQLVPKENSRRSFFCRMMEKALSRNDPGRYEIIHIVGQLRPIPSTTTAGEGITGAMQTLPATPSSASDHDSDDCNSEDEDNTWSSRGAAARQRVGTHMLVSFVRVVKDRPITELSLVESTQDEYITRHGMNGKILYTDHRISFVTGLMPSEVVGTSAFTYMHPDDMVWSIMAQRLMFSSTQGQGIVSYRLRCRDGSHVNLRSRGYLEVNKQTGQVESFVCINTVLSVKDAADEIKNQRRKLLPIVSSQECDDYLINISSSLPPELLGILKELMQPDALKKLFETLEDVGDSAGKQSTDTHFGQSDVNSEDGHTSKVSQEVTLNHSEELKDFNPFQKRPKRICNFKDSSSMTQNVVQGESSKELEEDIWHSVPSKRTSVDDFTGVITKKFSFVPESNPPCSSQQYNSNTSTQLCSPTMPQNSADEYYPPPSTGQQFSPMNFTPQIFADDCGPGSYQQSKHSIGSPSTSYDSGIASPLSQEHSQSRDKSPLPSSPYIQSVPVVDMSPETHDPMKLSPNYNACQNHGQGVRRNVSLGEDERGRNHHTRDSSFTVDINYQNHSVSSCSNRSSPGNYSQMSPGSFDDGKTNVVVSYPSGYQWHEKEEIFSASNYHQSCRNNSMPCSQTMQQVPSNSNKLAQIDEFPTQPIGIEKPQLPYHQSRQPQLQPMGSNMQSSLEPDFVLTFSQDFDMNFPHHSPLEQMPHLQEHQSEAEYLSPCSSSSQCLPVEVAGESRKSPHIYPALPATSDNTLAVHCSADFQLRTTNHCLGTRGVWGTQCQATGGQNLYPGLQEEGERLLAKDGDSRDGGAEVGGLYNRQCTPPLHHQHSQLEGKLL